MTSENSNFRVHIQNFIGTQPQCVYILSVFALVLQENCVVVTEVARPSKLKIFTVFSCMEKVF